MPVNAGQEYFLAEKKFHEASTTHEKIKALREMIAKAPKHKSSEKLLANLKTRLSKLLSQQEYERKQKSSKGKASEFTIKKTGACQIAFIGFPNSGKSTLLSKLSKTPVEIQSYAFTTTIPVVRMIPYGSIYLQGIEVPALYKGASKNPEYKKIFSLIRNADFIVVVCNEPKEYGLIKKELEAEGILLIKTGIRCVENFQTKIPHIKVMRSNFDDSNLVKKLWEKQNLIRILTIVKGQKKDNHPLVLIKGSTVEDAAKKIHKDFVKKFRFAKVWGENVKFQGQQVGLDYRLHDMDKIEIFLS